MAGQFIEGSDSDSGEGHPRFCHAPSVADVPRRIGDALSPRESSVSRRSLWRFSNAGQLSVAFVCTVFGRRPKTLYEVSLVKSFCGGQERFFLTFFLSFFLSKSGSGTFEQVSCIHVATALFAWPRRAVKPQRPQGLRHQAQGLDRASACRATIGHRANDF